MELARRRLDSWKEIATHLGRTVRTVQRWERAEGLPVHRLGHHKQASIYAYADELDAWWEQRSQALDAGDAPPTITAIPIAGTTGNGERSASVTGRWLPWVVAGVLVVAAAGYAAVDLRARMARTAAADALCRSGRQAWNLRTPEGFSAARASFEQAIQTDPGHARAHSGLADTFSLLWAFGLMERGDALPRAREYAERAVALDPNQAEGHASLSFVHWEESDRAGAEAEARRAIALDPNYATARHWYALYLQAMRRYDEAVTQATAAVALNPESPILATDLAIMLKSAGRAADAERVLQEARRRHPLFPDVYIQLAMLRRAAGRDLEAAELLRQGVALGDRRPRMVALLGCLERQSGDAVRARAVFDGLRARQPAEFFPRDVTIALLVNAGELDAAFGEIERALMDKDPWLGQLLFEHCYAPIRHDRRWPLFEERVMNIAALSAP